MASNALILVGHGGTASDIPRELISELKQLEGRRASTGESAPGKREAELDLQVRNWPRTADTDPYQAGLEGVARALQAALSLIHI